MCLLTETLTGSDRNNLSCDHHPLFCLCFFFSLQVTWWFGRWFWEEWVQMFVVAHQMVQHYPHSSLRVWLSWTQCTDWLIFAWLDEEKVRKFFVDRTCGTKSVSVQFPDDCKWLFTLLWLLLIEIFLPLLLIQQKIFNLMLTSLCFIIHNLWLSSCLFLASWFFFFSILPSFFFSPLILHRGLKVFAMRRRCLQAWNRHAVVQQRQALLQQATSGWYTISFCKSGSDGKRQFGLEKKKKTVPDFSLHSWEDVLKQAFLSSKCNNDQTTSHVL